MSSQQPETANAAIAEELKLVDRSGRSLSFREIKDSGAQAILLYFSASWCGPCQAFTPSLVAMYEKAKAAGKPFECIFVSGCKTPRDFQGYLQKMPFPAIPFADSASRNSLMRMFRIKAFPSMVMIDPVTRSWFYLNGRKAVAEDPEGDKLPWTEYKKPVFCLDKLEHTDPMPGPVWAERLYISLFLEGYLQNAETHGGDKKRCGDIAALLHVHHYVSDMILKERPEWLNTCGEEDLKAIGRANTMFKNGMALCKGMMKIKEPNHFAGFLAKFCKSLSELKSGQEMIIPGGWQDTDSGHCIMHVVKKQPKDGFTFSIHNTGKGIKFHRSTASKPPGMKFQASAVFHDIPINRIIDHGFWYMFFKIHVTKSDDHRHEILYDVLYPHILGMPFGRAVTKEAKNSAEPGSDFYAAQRAETCYYSSISRCYDFLLAQYGLSEQKITQFKFAFMRAMLNMAHTDMQQVTSINHSDARLVRTSAQLVSKAACTEAEAKRLTGAALAEILAKVDQIEEMILRRAKGLDLTSVPQLVPSFDGKWRPLRSFRMYMRKKSVEEFAGWPDAVPRNHLIDMMQLPRDFVNTSKDVSTAIKTCISLCKLISRKHTSNSYFYICSLIQQLFVKVLPLPIPPNERKQVSDCVWASMEVERKEYLEIVNDIQLLARYYTAAARSVQSNRQFKGANVVVMGCIMACLDAMVRVYSVTEPSIVAMVLNGTQHLFKNPNKPQGPSAVRIIQTDAEFEAEMKNCIENDELAIVDFYASWCGPCKQIAPLFAAMAKQYTNKGVTFMKLDAEKLKSLTSKYRVRAYPTFKFFYGGKVVDTFQGASAEGLERKLKEILAKIDAGQLEEKPRTLIEADQSKVLQMEAFGFGKLAIEWALRSTNNNVQMAVQRLLETNMESLPILLSVEESDRAAIRRENEKILKRVAEKKKMREEKKKAKEQATAEKKKADETSSSSDPGKEEKKEKAFNRIEAMKLLRPDFYLCTHDGYGTHLDELTNISLLLEPALAVARGKMLRYFLAQEKLGTKAVFNFKTRVNCTTFLSRNSPTMDLVKTLCNCMGYDLQPKDEEKKTMDDGISFIEAATWYLTHPKSPFAKEHPELLALRDTSLLFRVLVTETTHRRHVKLQRWTVSHAQVAWKIKEPGGVNNAKTQVDLNAACFNQDFVCVETKPTKSPADPGIWIKKGLSLEKVNEDDVLHKRQLPTFDNALSQEDSEYLLSLLTTPYIRIPLVVAFFASKDRVSALINVELQNLFESILFEPMRWTPDGAPDIRYVPAKNSELIGCASGLLLNEIQHAPGVLIPSMMKLTEEALLLNTGSYTSSSTAIILFLIRMLSGVHRYLSFFTSESEKGKTMDSKKKAELEKYGKDIAKILIEKARPILVQWEQQSQQQNDLRSSCIMNAHMAVLYRGLQPKDMTLSVVQPIMEYLAFLQTWHSPGLGQGALEEEKKRRQREAKEEKKRKKSKEEIAAERVIIETPLLVPEHVYFDMLNIHRPGLVGFFSKAKPSDVDDVMQGILRVATRNQRLQSKEWKRRENEPIGVFVAQNKEIEVNVQAVELYFRNSHIEPVPNHMARTDDFALIFGKDPQHCALVAAHEHRHWVRLVGKSYNIYRWEEPDEKITPVNMPEKISGGSRGFKWLGKTYSRPFPEKVKPSEQWILKVIEPTILSQFGQWKKVPYVKEKKFFMSTTNVPEDAFSTVVIALDKGVWRIFKVVRHLNVCFMYVLLEHGRRMYPSLVYTSDTRFCYFSMEPDTSDRGTPYHPLLRHEAGKITVKVPRRDSVVISRDVSESIEETFTPERLLRGIIPAALTENFFFWQRDKDDHLVGYPKELNHPDFQYKLRVRLIEFKGNGLCGVITRSPLTKVDILSNTEISSKSFFDVKMQLADNDPMVVAMNNSKLEVIVSQGYPMYIAKQVMEQFRYDLPVAQSWLANPKNKEKLDKMKAELEELRKNGKEDSALNPKALSDVKLTLPSLIRSDSQKEAHMLVLFDLVSVPADSVLGRLVKLLTRIEVLGYILVWTDSLVKDYNSLCKISHVELPRLKLVFHPRIDADGKVRLYSKDHSDLFISDFRDERLDKLSTGIPHCLIMENAARELYLLVPNCPVHRPYISRCPFSTELKLDHRDPEWLNNMASRFFLYPVHGSHTFLVTPTLSSAMYLILLRMMSRQYDLAFRVVQSCEADRKLSKDEDWIFKQLRNAHRDKHPNAHAVRLKFSLVVMYCGQSIEELWELQSEFKEYILKLDQVSMNCRLSLDEEIMLLDHIRNSNEFAQYEKVENQLEGPQGALDAELSNRHNYIQMLLAGREKGDRKEDEKKEPSNFTHGQNDMQFGENTMWDRVESNIDSFYTNFDVKYRTWRAQCFYYRPRHALSRSYNIYHAAKAIDTLNSLWKDQVTGVIKQLGFYFVGELLTGRASIYLVDSTQNCAHTLGKLFARILLLKNMQWGGRANMELMSSYNDNSWYPYVILGLLHHWKPKYGSLPNFYGMDEFAEGMRTFDFGGLTMLGHHLNRILTVLQPVVRSSDRLQARSYPLFMPMIISRIPVPPFKSMRSIPHVSDFTCNVRSLEPFTLKLDNSFKDVKSVELSEEDCKWMKTQPLGPIELKKFVKVVEKSKNLPGKMPFDLSKHEAADSYVAREMLKRLAKDIKLHADMENARKLPILLKMGEVEFAPIGDEKVDMKGIKLLVENSSASLTVLRQTLLKLRDTDSRKIEVLAKVLIKIANSVKVKNNRMSLVRELNDVLDKSGDEGKALTWSEQINKIAKNVDEKEVPKPTQEQLESFNDETDRYLYLLNRKAGVETSIWLEYLSATILSKNAYSELSKLNPFLPESEMGNVMRSTIGFLTFVNRVGCIDRCLACIRRLENLLKGLNTLDKTTWTERKEKQKQIGHQASQLARLLVAERYCVGKGVAQKSKEDEFDPRYLIFEYLFNILLRKKQVVLVNKFLNANASNQSLVRQMIMGAGKSTVVGPMLSLILADGHSLVTLVVPSSLLEMSRNMMRARFTRVIPKRVHTFSFDRSCIWVKEVTKMYSKLKDARATKGVVVTTSEAIKSLMLKHIELLDAMRAAPPQLTKLGEKRLRIKSVMADEIARIMRLWKNEGVLILDEVDLLLHPLRSELNFPIGPKKPLELSPHRWELPIHLLDAVFYATSGRSSVQLGMAMSEKTMGLASGVFGLSSAAHALLAKIREVLNKGIRGQFLQTSPHIVLLDAAWYHANLKPVLAPWVLLWLRSKQHVQLTLGDDQALAYLQRGPTGEALYLEGLKKSGKAVPEPIEKTHRTVQKKMLNLAADWLQSYAPHVLTKIDRVSYGLLLKEDMERVDHNTPASRKLMAVPFVGKDVPSHSSEFAQPDVLIGLSVLAYRYEGLRLSDIVEVVKQLQNSMREEVGPLTERPSARRFSRWLELGRKRMRHEWVKKQKQLLEERQETQTLQLKRTLSRQEKKELAVESKHQSSMMSEEDAPVYNVNPLHIFQLSDRYQLDNLFKCVSSLPELVHYYLDQMVFPATLQHQETKISASGQELGGEILFPRRLGFSGTPSDLLPLELGKCGYEKGSEGSILNTLMDEQVVSYELVGLPESKAVSPRDEKKMDEDVDLTTSWSVHGLLTKIATARPPYNALIDTGALVTGMTNEQVARFLMQNGISEVMEACVFLDSEDRQMALLRSGKIIPLKQCGVELSRRFSFYDQVHTTGMDIKQTMNAVAVVTLGKDMTHRDFSQGCYRMRGIGKGQTIHLFIIPEVLKLIRKEVGESDSLQRDVNTWLLVNSMRSEKLQFMQLCIQNTANVFRKKAHRKLVTSTNVTEHQALAGRRYWRFQEDYGETMEGVRKAIMIFREKVNFSVRGRAVQEQRTFASILEDMQKEFGDTIKGDQKSLDIIQDIQALASNAGNPLELSRQKSLNQEMVQEAEQEAQKQKEKQVEQEQQVQVRFSREDESHVPWAVLRLTETPKGLYKEDAKGVLAQRVHERHAFYHFKQFSIRGLGKSDIDAPSNMLLSHNYFRPEWASTGQRRLKNIFVLLEWQRPKEAKDTKTSDSAGPLSAVNDKLIKRMFQLLDFQGKGYIARSDVKLLPKLLGEEASAEELKEMLINLDPKNTGKVEYPEFRRLVVEWSNGSTSGTHVQKKFVCISLTEAETVRKIIHSNHPLLRVNNEHRVGLALRLLQGGQVIDRSPKFVESTSVHVDVQSAIACFRFINCDFFYDDIELLMLMRALARTKNVVRRAFFENALRCRRRDRQRWNDTPLAKVFTSADHFHVLFNRAILFRIRASLLSKGILLRDAFDIFDSVGDGQLYETEVAYALRKGFLNLSLSDDEVSAIVQHCDKENNGQISKYEFLEAICLEEDYKTDEERYQKGDFKQYSPIKLPEELKKRYIEEGERRKKRIAAEISAIEEMEKRIQEEKKAFRFRPIFEALDRGQKGFITISDVEFFLPKFNPMEFVKMAQAVGKPEAKQLSFKDFCKAGISLAKHFIKKGGNKEPEKKNPGMWSCPACTLWNKDSDSKCTACGHAKPAKIVNDSEEKEDDDLLNFEPPMWVCNQCTTRNERYHQKCKMCGSKKPPQKKIQLVDVLWECKSCTYQNTRYADSCAVCNTPRDRGTTGAMMVNA